MDKYATSSSKLSLVKAYGIRNATHTKAVLINKHENETAEVTVTLTGVGVHVRHDTLSNSFCSAHTSSHPPWPEQELASVRRCLWYSKHASRFVLVHACMA